MSCGTQSQAFDSVFVFSLCRWLMDGNCNPEVIDIKTYLDPKECLPSPPGKRVTVSNWSEKIARNYPLFTASGSKHVFDPNSSAGFQSLDSCILDGSGIQPWNLLPGAVALFFWSFFLVFLERHFGSCCLIFWIVKSSQDLILNAVALSAILQVDEMLGPAWLILVVNRAFHKK